VWRLLMRAHARIVVEADRRGGTRASVLRSEPPLLLRRTGPPAGDDLGVHPTDGAAGPLADTALAVHLVGGAAGPLRGDDLRLDVEVGPGAWLDIRSVAASLALPGPPGRPPSRIGLCAAVAKGATLRWMPEPLIAAADCHHITSTEIRVAAGGTLVWRDELVCGRHGEDPGDASTDVTVRYAGATLYRHEFAVGPAAPGWCGAAVLGERRAAGSLVVVGAGPPPAATAADDAAIMQLAGPGYVAMAVGADIRQVRAVLDPLTAPWDGRSRGSLG
jgi:urease accessory protein